MFLRFLLPLILAILISTSLVLIAGWFIVQGPNLRISLTETLAGTNCSVDTTNSLGAWLAMECDGQNALSGSLRGVAGAADEIEAFVEDFLGIHGRSLTCFRGRDGLLACRSGAVDLGAQLANHGFAAPGRERQHVEIWLATLMGFCVPAAALLWQRAREQENRKEMIAAGKENLREHLESLRTVFKSFVGKDPKPYTEMRAALEKAEQRRDELQEMSVYITHLGELLRSIRSILAEQEVDDEESAEIEKELVDVIEELEKA